MVGRFWKQRNEFKQLEGELRHARPRPSSEYLESLATQLNADRPARSRRPAMRYRVVVAVALTSTLGVVGAASGGLNYAHAASSHSLTAVAHVFTAPHQSPAAPTAAPAAAPVAPDASASASDSVAAAIATANSVQSANRGSDQGSSRDDHNNGRRGRDDNAFRHQYIEFVFVCLRVPPRHPFVFITLRVPSIAADRLIALGLATPGAC
jgi:hypothetical protein